MTMRGNQTQCRRCSAPAYLPEGEFLIESGVLKLISGPDVTVRQLQKFNQLLDSFKDKRPANYKELSAAVAKEAPRFSGFVGKLWKKKNDIGWVITTAMAAVGLVFQMKAGEPLTEDAMARAVERGYRAAAVEPESRSRAPFSLPESLAGIGKDDPEPQVDPNDGQTTEGIGDCEKDHCKDDGRAPNHKQDPPKRPRFI